MKKKNIFLLLSLCFMVSGCASFNRHTENVGKNIGQTGTKVLITSAIVPVFIPIGIVGCIPFYGVGSMLYYPACLLAHDKPEKDPFDL